MALKKATKLTDAEQVDDFINKLAMFQAETTELRNIIKNTNHKLGERIKWNAPSYYYQPELSVKNEKIDIVTFGPYRSGKVLLVFHHPFIVKINSPLLEGDYKDRRLVYFDNLKSIREAKIELKRILTDLLNAIDQHYQL
jgi:uncharacterized protein YdeI (YjbR/CyaY-like superfamily)